MTTTKNSKNADAENNLFAIAETSGRQFLFKVNKYYDLDRIDAKEKEKITLNNILLIKDNKKISIGKPYIKDAKVELEVMSHLRDKKIIVYKMRPKKKTRRKMGHRQELTRVMVKSITINESDSKSSTKSVSSKKSTSTKKESS
tara:strand:- start:659 stop:1090 length:432 start_codon:yes stop_codon:yes gene_type:complete